MKKNSHNRIISRKGQLFGKPFTYIFALIVAALTLIWGIRAINDIREKSELVELTTFITELREDIQTYYNFDAGSSKTITLILPPKVEKVCFTNPGSIPNTYIISQLNFELEDNEQYNTYILPLDSFSITRFKVNHLNITETENPLCIDTKGRFTATIETQEGYVEISK